MQLSLATVNNQLSRVEQELRSLDSDKTKHQTAVVVSIGANDDGHAHIEQQTVRNIDSKMSVLEQEKQSLESQKAEIEAEISSIESRLTENEAEHKTLVDRKLALTG